MLMQLAALLPLLRGLASPAYYVVQRDRGFQHIAGMRWRRVLRLRVGLALAYRGAGASSC